MALRLMQILFLQMAAIAVSFIINIFENIFYSLEFQFYFYF